MILENKEITEEESVCNDSYFHTKVKETVWNDGWHFPPFPTYHSDALLNSNIPFHSHYEFSRDSTNSLDYTIYEVAYYSKDSLYELDFYEY